MSFFAAGSMPHLSALWQSVSEGARFSLLSAVSETPFTGSGYGTALYNYLHLVPASGESVPHVTHSAVSALIGGAGAVGVLMLLAALWALLRVVAFNRCPATLRIGFAFLILPPASVLTLTDAYIDISLSLVFAAFLFNSAGADYRSVWCIRWRRSFSASSPGCSRPASRSSSPRRPTPPSR